MTDRVEHGQELWKKYIRGELSPDMAGKLESLLKRDDAVFAQYLEILTSLEEELPSIHNEAAFVADILQCLPDDTGLHGDKKKERGYPGVRRQWMNYGIAAVATLLLLGGGVFDQFTSPSTGLSDSGTSISSRWMERAGSWMDDFMNEGKDR